MDRIELRTGGRITARSRRAKRQARSECGHSRARAPREKVSLPESALDEERARRACAPMGELHSIVVSHPARKTKRTYYVIDPDPAMRPEYERLGFRLVPGCLVLVDAAALRPLATLTVKGADSSLATTPDDAPGRIDPCLDLAAT